MNEMPHALDALAERGWTSIPGWMPEAEARALASTAKSFHEEGRFKRAGIGKEGDARVVDDVRRDDIFWLDRGMSDAIDDLIDRLESLRLRLNEEYFLGLKDFEAHFAIYASGGFYRRHVDRFRSDDKRTISAVLYLNEGWRPDDGGRLKIFSSAETPAAESLIEPTLGTLALFKSDTTEHEVEPARRERRSIAIWFRR